MFCREEVEAQYEEWLKGQTGKSPERQTPETALSTDEIKEHLAGLIAALRLNTNPDGNAHRNTHADADTRPDAGAKPRCRGCDQRKRREYPRGRGYVQQELWQAHQEHSHQHL